MKFTKVFVFKRYYNTQSLLPVPVIKVPKYVYQHVEKVKKRGELQKLAIKKKIIYRGNTSVPIISSTNGEFNHYLGEVYNPKYPLPLQTKYWFKAKSCGQKFTINAYNTNPSLPSTSEEEYVDEYIPDQFSKMDLSPQMISNLTTALNFAKPTRIQTLAIPQIAEGRHAIVTTEPGSGKSVAYLAPIIDKIASIKSESTLYKNALLGLIITPGRELAEQIANVGSQLASNLGVTVKVLMPKGSLLHHLKPDLNTNPHVLVASIGAFLSLYRRDIIKLGNLKYLVLDEADTLLDDSFIEDTSYIFRKLTIRSDMAHTDDGPYGTQVCFVSSIYPSNIHAIFDDNFNEKNLLKILSPYLHRVPQHFNQQFIRTSNETRIGDLLQLVKADYEKKKPVMIFCNKSPSCDWLSDFLQKNGVQNVKYHGALSFRKRSQALRHFFGGLSNVLVCTDLASRGLDTQVVKHVINYDFPNNVSDYLLRAGRVGRVGTNQGRVTSLIVSVTGNYTLQEIEKAVKQSTYISKVDSNIKAKINKLYFTP